MAGLGCDRSRRQSTSPWQSWSLPLWARAGENRAQGPGQRRSPSGHSYPTSRVTTQSRACGEDPSSLQPPRDSPLPPKE